jgi:hypothetical protein
MRAIACLAAVIATLAALTGTASPGRPSSCRTNRTFMEASRDGTLPAIYAALHGGAAPANTCFAAKP